MGRYNIISALAAEPTTFPPVEGWQHYTNYSPGEDAHKWSFPGKVVYVEVNARSNEQSASYRFTDMQALERFFRALVEAQIHGRKDNVIDTEVRFSINFSNCESASIAVDLDCRTVLSDDDLNERVRVIIEVAALTSVMLSCELVSALFSIEDGKRVYRDILGRNLELTATRGK